jgi:hypothetical protein
VDNPFREKRTPHRGEDYVESAEGINTLNGKLQMDAHKKKA